MTLRAPIVALWLALSVPAIAQTDDTTFEHASIQFIHTYLQQWSAPNAQAMSYMETAFADKTIYFGETLSHTALMRAKARFVERWPIRRFMARPNSISVACGPSHLCTVWGLIDWQCQSPQRRTTSSGTSVFEFQVQDGQTVINEGGFVIARGGILARHAVNDRPAHPVVTDTDITHMKADFYLQATERADWINSWLQEQRRFLGEGISLGRAGVHELASDSGTISYAVLESKQGPIACVMEHKLPIAPAGTRVALRGTVAIFIDETLYLSRCSYG